ncbi:MAG: sulfur carrier protein ThiS [Gemmatimonadetes bacterium]|nr:sulfur carrier protein ThiS [Gemmatimonadota bacterium]
MGAGAKEGWVSVGQRDEERGTGVLLQVNGRERWVPTGTTVGDLLAELDLVAALVVVERNREILQRDLYGRTTLAEGDALELVHFVGGGTDS